MCPWVGPHAPPFGRQLWGLPSRVEYLSPQGVLLPLVYVTTASPLWLVRDGQTWWVVELMGDRHKAVVYTPALFEQVEHPLMRRVGEVEEVRVGRAEEVHERAILRAFESHMDRCAEAEEVEDITEQIKLAMEVTNSGGREQPRWIVPPGTEQKNRKEALARARRLVEGFEV